MKTTVTFAAATVALALGMAPSRAASTNIVQNINFQFTAYEQGGTNNPSANLTVVKMNALHFNTKDVIGILGAAMNTNFPPNARLVRVTEITATTTNKAFQVRAGGTVLADVTASFTGTGFSHTVRSQVYNSKTRIGHGVTVGLYDLAIGTGGAASLKADGFATSKHAGIRFGKTLLSVDDLTAQLSGYGTDTKGVPFTANGTVTVVGHTTEVK